MVGTRFRKILRDIWSRKARTLLVSVSIFIGVFGTVTLFTMGDLLVRQLEADLDENELAMVRAFLAPSPDAEIDNEALLATMRAIPDVTDVEGQAVNPVYWKESGDDDFQSSTIFAYTEPFEEIQLEPMRLYKGEFPAAGAKEIVVERRFADKYDLAVGDPITLRVLSQADEGSTIPEETWTISGMVFFPYSYQGMNNILPVDSIFARYEDAQYLAGFEGLSSLYLRYTDYDQAKAHLIEMEEIIAAQGSYIPVFTMNENPKENGQIEFARTTGSTMGMLALLALIVSGFLVLNVVTAIVTEQKNQIGVMKSVGASRLDTFAIYSGIALLYGIFGVIPGVILGIPSGYFAAQGLAASSNTIIENFDFSTRAIVLGIGMGLLVPVLASIIPVWGGTRVKIIEAITDLGISARYGSGPLARLVTALPLPITMRQGISNVLRKKGRMALTGLTLTIAAGAFMGVFAVFASLSNVLDELFNTFQYEIGVTPDNAADVEQAEILIRNQFENLSYKGEAIGLAIKIDGFDKEYDPATGPPALFASGYDPTTGSFAINLEDGEHLSGQPNEIIISHPIAEATNKGVGDSMTIHAGGQSGDYTIVGISTYPFDNVWFNWQDLSKLAGFVDANGDPMPGGFLLRVEEEDPTADEVADTIDELNEVMLANGITATYDNLALFQETISEQVSVFQTVFNFAAVLIALVGAVGLLITLSMSVFERQKEIGVMRSIGARSSTIIGQFLTEGMIVGFLAWLVGLPLSYGLANLLMNGLGLGEEFKLIYPITGVVIGFVGIIGITAIASVWPSVAAARKTVSDILRYQ